MNTYENIFLEKYSILNPEQKLAVDTVDGPVFVMAGPGTGKTQILTLRIANILRVVNDIEPENILALTFTNAAAYNMRERLSSIVGGELAHRVTISTFHSFAEDTMKKFPEYFPQFTGARLMSPVEQIELLESILKNMKNLQHFSKFKRRENTVKSIAFSLGKIKSEGLSSDEFIQQVDEKYHADMEHPDMFYKRKYGKFEKGDIKVSAVRKLDAKRAKSMELAEIYTAYQDALVAQKLYDFSDLILSFVNELHADTEFQTEIQEQYHYMLVDEHQDTNDAQNKILHALIDNPVWEGKPNIFVVGDTKQAIFRFAGASEKSYSQLSSKLENITTIELQKNYRSHQSILDTSHSLIKKSEHHSDEINLEAFFDKGGILEYRNFQNYKMENLFVAQNIKKQIDDGKKPDDIAVLYRNNRDGAEISHMLSVYGVPVRDYSKKNIL
ncbi:MAG: ATP-dependent helicase, partial [Minisyncoccia bacterium]